jgi:hypothetical protein
MVPDPIQGHQKQKAGVELSGSMYKGPEFHHQQLESYKTEAEQGPGNSSHSATSCGMMKWK